MINAILLYMIEIVDRRTDLLIAEVEGSDLDAFMTAGRVRALLAREAKTNPLNLVIVLPENHTIPMIGA